MSFPYGNPALALLLVAIAAGVGLMSTAERSVDKRATLVLLTFSKEHAEAYHSVIQKFEQENNVRVQLQVVSQGALQGRLESSMQVGAEVPDMVELLDGTLGVFTRGPLEDVGFIDLTQRVHATGLYNRVVRGRFTKWSSRGHIFALPHDVHPVMLAYRRDLVQNLGIDVSKLQTWDEFCRVGRDVVTKDLDGDGVPDRYMLDLPATGGDALRILLLQHGGNIFNAKNEVAFDDDHGVDVVEWYVKQVAGPGRISFSAGWGQNLSKAMTDGLVLFYFCPDWRMQQFEADVPSLSGKLSLMPLPAWTPDGIHTTTWGGTGLAITKQCKNPELAWKLAMHLYYDSDELGERFSQTQILPPLKEAWSKPQFDAPSDYFGGLHVGRVYAALAEQVPEEQCNAYLLLAEDKLNEAFSNTLTYYTEHGGDIHEVARKELKYAADRVRVIMARNRFQQTTEPNAEAAVAHGEAN